jgi:branched-chain amino acid transport system permease protein
MALLIQLLLNAIVKAAIFSLMAVGFGLVYRSLRFFHIAFGAVYVASAYGMVAGMVLGLPIGFAVGVLTGIILGVSMDRGVYLPLETAGASKSVLFVASLGVYIVLVNTIPLIFGNEMKVLYTGSEPSFGVGSLILTRIQIIQLFTGGGSVVAFWLLVRKSTFFKAIWAMGEAPELVLVLGLPRNQLRLVLFGASSFFGSLAALLTAMEVGIDPHVGMQALLVGAVAVLVGGVDVFWGWIGGAVILALLQSLAVWQFSSRWGTLITFTMLIITLLARPQGLFSPAKRREER